MEFTLQPLRDIFKKAGARRISDSAAEELGRVLEARSRALLEEAKALSQHAGRKTVMREDVRLARKNLKK